MAARQQPALMPMVVHQQNFLAVGMEHHGCAGDVAGMKLIAPERRIGQFEQRQNQLAAFFFFGRGIKGADQCAGFNGGSHSELDRR